MDEMREPAGGSYFIIIPAPVKLHPTLSAHAKLLFGEIAVKCNVRGYCWATNQYFADVFACNIRSIQRYIKELEDANFVAIEMIEDAEKGLIRKIKATELSQYVATELSPPPTTELSRPPVTKQTPPHDSGVTPPRDKSVVYDNKSLDNKSNNNSKKTKAPGNGAAPSDLFGNSDQPQKEKKTAPRAVRPSFEIYSRL